MRKWPEVVALTLCERFEIKQGMASLVGLFQGLHFASFPSPVKDLVVYAGLSGKSVEGTMELAVTRLVGEKDLFSYKRWLTFPEHVITINLVVPVMQRSRGGQGLPPTQETGLANGLPRHSASRDSHASVT